MHMNITHTESDGMIFWEITVYFEWINEHIAEDISFPKNGLRELQSVNYRRTRDNMTERQVALLGSTGFFWVRKDHYSERRDG